MKSKHVIVSCVIRCGQRPKFRNNILGTIRLPEIQLQWHLCQAQMSYTRHSWLNHVKMTLWFHYFSLFNFPIYHENATLRKCFSDGLMNTIHSHTVQFLHVKSYRIESFFKYSSVNNFLSQLTKEIYLRIIAGLLRRI